MKFKSLITMAIFSFILSWIAMGQSPSPSPEEHPRHNRLRVSQGVSQGQLIHRIEPQYPASAREKHIEGDVILKLVIDKGGNVIETERMQGDEELAAAAIDAVRQWKFKPYLLNREPIEIETTAVLHFRL